jgi:hypothetical protein
MDLDTKELYLTEILRAKELSSMEMTVNTKVVGKMEIPTVMEF